MKGARVHPLKETLDDKLRAQVEPRDLPNHFGFQIFFNGGHEDY
jgi:hypothetical protein